MAAHPDQAYPREEADVIIAKHRNGPTGRIKLRFKHDLAKFENLGSAEPTVAMSEFQGFPPGRSITPSLTPSSAACCRRLTTSPSSRQRCHVIAAMYRKKGYPRFVSFNELLGQRRFDGQPERAGEEPEETLRRA